MKLSMARGEDGASVTGPRDSYADADTQQATRGIFVACNSGDGGNLFPGFLRLNPDKRVNY